MSSYKKFTLKEKVSNFRNRKKRLRNNNFCFEENTIVASNGLGGAYGFYRIKEFNSDKSKVTLIGIGTNVIKWMPNQDCIVEPTDKSNPKHLGEKPYENLKFKILDWGNGKFASVKKNRKSEVIEWYDSNKKYTSLSD